MFCEKCGNELKEDAQFCRKCGTKVSDNDTTQQPQSDFTNTENLFDVELQIVNDENKLEVIKVVCELTELSLTEAKIMVDMVDKVPVLFKKAVPKSEAENIKARFIKVGALVTLKEHGKTQETIPKSTSTVEPHGTGIYCPKCHSYDLDTTSETETKISGGGYGFGSGCCGWILLGPIGLLCGFCGRSVKSSSTTREFWKCKSCGHKFRDPDDERNELWGVGIIALIASVVTLIAGIIFAAMDINFFWIPSWVYITAGIIGTGLSIFALHYIEKEYKKKTESYQSYQGIIPKNTVFFIFKVIAVWIGGLLGVIICAAIASIFMSRDNENIAVVILMTLMMIGILIGTFIVFFKVIGRHNKKNK